MKSSNKLLLIAVALLFIASTIPNVEAEYRATLHPSQGSVLTEIYLEVRNIGGVLYLYWDDFFLGTFFENFPYEDFVGFDIFFSPPNVHPYSDVGNHTVFFEVWYKYWDGEYYYVYWNCSLTFEIIEYYPCDEYLALNATYHELLHNYTGLLGDYGTLLSEYNELLTDYDSLSFDYNNLFASFERLNSSYYGLESSYASLNSIYSELSDSTRALESNNNNLTASYNALIGQLNITRNLGYVFTATTVVLIATTVYFAMRKPKTA